MKLVESALITGMLAFAAISRDHADGKRERRCLHPALRGCAHVGDGLPRARERRMPACGPEKRRNTHTLDADVEVTRVRSEGFSKISAMNLPWSVEA